MTRSDPEFSAALRQVAAETLEVGNHPSPLELLDLGCGELIDSRAEEVREHLSLCAACRHRFVSGSQLPETTLSAEFEVSNGRMEQSWLDFQARLGSSPQPWLRRRGRVVFRFAAGLAAVLLVALLALRIGRFGAPDSVADLPVAVTVLWSTYGEISRSDQASRLDCPPTPGAFVLLLPVAGQQGRPSLDVVIRGSVGESLEFRHVLVHEEERISILVPDSALADGDYRLELQAEGRVLREFGFTVACQADREG